MPRLSPEPFTAAYPSDRAACDAIRDVATTARPADPQRCPQRAFNDSRQRAGHPQLARADQLVKTLGGPWSDLLAVIFDPARDELHWIALQARDTRRRGLTPDAAAEALRVAAACLRTPTVRPAEYERTIGPLRAAAKRKNRHGGAADFLFPTAAQIEYAVGWNEALARASLDQRGPAGGRAGLDPADALDLFLTEHGYVVGRDSLRSWTREQGISLAKRDHSQAIAELRANRDALGRWTPPGILPARLRPPNSKKAATPPTRDTPRLRRTWTLPEIRAGLALAVAESTRRGHRRLTQDLLKDIAKTDPRIPSWSPVERAAKRVGRRGGDLLQDADESAKPAP